MSCGLFLVVGWCTFLCWPIVCLSASHHLHSVTMYHILIIIKNIFHLRNQWGLVSNDSFMFIKGRVSQKALTEFGSVGWLVKKASWPCSFLKRPWLRVIASIVQVLVCLQMSVDVAPHHGWLVCLTELCLAGFRVPGADPEHQLRATRLDDPPCSQAVLQSTGTPCSAIHPRSGSQSENPASALWASWGNVLET